MSDGKKAKSGRYEWKPGDVVVEKKGQSPPPAAPKGGKPKGK